MLKLEYRPFGVLNLDAFSDFVFVCDHADNIVPRSLFGLGLDGVYLSSHIAYDIGALSVSKALANSFKAPVIWQKYSRLVIDCNRQIDHKGLIPAVSDGITIYGNQSLIERDRRDRINLIFKPYHKEIGRLLDKREKIVSNTFFISIHSFTPIMDGIKRPWKIGVLSGTDKDFSSRVLELLRSRYDFCIGDNEPYQVDSKDFTIPEHARKRNLPSVLLEIRQDLIDSEKKRQFWIKTIKSVLSKARRDYLAEHS